MNETIVERLEDLFRRRGAEAYLGEAVTVADHMLQCAALARREGAPDELLAAALLHDIGHLTGSLGEYTPEDIEDRRHESAGADFLQGSFPASVVESVRLHVAAKRYLCATDPAYYGRLSKASKHSLELQGGPMRADEAQAFDATPFHDFAVRVRRWDDAGKVADLEIPPFADYRTLLARLAL